MPTRYGGQHWLERGAEARTTAALMKDEESKNMMLNIAAHYEQIAKIAERIAAADAAPVTRNKSN